MQCVEQYNDYSLFTPGSRICLGSLTCGCVSRKFIKRFSLILFLNDRNINDDVNDYWLLRKTKKCRAQQKQQQHQAATSQVQMFQFSVSLSINNSSLFVNISLWLALLQRGAYNIQHKPKLLPDATPNKCIIWMFTTLFLCIFLLKEPLLLQLQDLAGGVTWIK